MLINEVKALSISQGNTFKLAGDIGKFKKGETVMVDSVNASGNDIAVQLSNESGVTDTFYLDRNDNFEELGN